MESIPTMEEAVVHSAPHLIIVDIDAENRTEKLNFLDQLSRLADRIPIVVTARALDADLMLGCVKKGVRDFLRQPLQDTEVRDITTRLLGEMSRQPEGRQLGHTYSFFSYKGGIGTTFLSCNTAVALARQSNARVLIWDMVMQNGDVPFFFDYEPVATLTDLLENADKIDAPYLHGTLPPHSSGVSILPGPRRPEEAEQIRNDQVQGLHATLRQYFDYIVVDAGHSLTDSVISVMDASKYIMLTTDLHLPVLKNTLRCLEVLERLGYVEGKFRIVLNRYNSKYEKFDLSKAEEILRYPITYTFSNDYVTASRSLNAGMPVADLDENSVLVQQFKGLSRLLTGDFQKTEAQSGSLFGKLKGMLSPGKAEKAQNSRKRVKERRSDKAEKKETPEKPEEKEIDHAAK